jgi:glycosyltransferase involved in cell wall biosynthesis
VAETIPKKIAILLPSLKFGGAERVALTLARALEENDCAIDILLMRKQGEFLAEAEAKFRVVDLQCNKTYKLPGRLVTYLWRNRPHGLISSFWKLNLCACLVKPVFPRLKLILWEHSMSSKSPNSPVWLYAPSTSVFYQMANKVVAVSTGVRDDIDHFTIGLRRKLVVIFNPIEPPNAEESATEDVALPKEKQVVSVGRLDENKNHRLLLEAFALVAARTPARLSILGEGTLRGHLEEFCANLGLNGRVKFFGFHPRPYEVLAASDLLVVTSNREGLPSVMIEAMYCGLPVVSTDCGAGIGDILLGGRYGRIVPRNDKEALAEAIEAELRDRRPSDVQKEGATKFLPHVAANRFLDLMR